MRARLSVHSNQHAEIDIDHELPIFPEPNARRASRFTTLLFHRSLVTGRTNGLQEFAEAMWRRNRGCWSVEIDHPGRYEEFARDLLFVDGLNGITAASRFTLGIDVSRCFDAEEVASTVARTVHGHFFQTEELVVSRGPAWHPNVVLRADPARVPPTGPAVKTDRGGETPTPAVAVFRVMEPTDRDFGEPLFIAVELLSVVEVDSGDPCNPRELCAEAWIKAVGLERQEVLREQLDAPDAVVQAQGNRELIANELLDLPAGFGPINGFLYDNLVETWLIELGWDDPSDEPSDPEQTSGHEPD